jgi:hypothetical protein
MKEPVYDSIDCNRAMVNYLFAVLKSLPEQGGRAPGRNTMAALSIARHGSCS